jgi:hypothetical protein
VTTPSDVVGLLFDETIVRYFHAIVSVSIATTSNNLNSGYELKGILLDGGYVLNSTWIGEDTGIKFSITPNGQVQYTSSNLNNWTSSIIKFKAITTSI